MDQRLEKFRNKLIVFEAGDNSGKTTLSKALYDMLMNEGIVTVYTKQPGDAPGDLKDLMRSLCIDKKWNLHPLANLFAFLLDRVENTDKVVLPALRNGHTVICDRWYYSTIAYQFYGKQLIEQYHLNKQFAYWINRVASLNKEPDVVFFLERSEEKMKERISDDSDQFETASYEFKLRVRKAYYDMAKENPLFVRIPVIEGDIPGTLNRIIGANF